MAKDFDSDNSLVIISSVFPIWSIEFFLILVLPMRHGSVILKLNVSECDAIFSYRFFKVSFPKKCFFFNKTLIDLGKKSAKENEAFTSLNFPKIIVVNFKTNHKKIQKKSYLTKTDPHWMEFTSIE